MLHELAITPNVFHTVGYVSDDVCDAHMQGMRQALLEWTIVRSLRAGAWRIALEASTSEMSGRARELLKKLVRRKRLFPSPACLDSEPTNDIEWCEEALESHSNAPFLGVLSSKATKGEFPREELVASVDLRSAAIWWKILEAGHPDGPQSGRTLRDYRIRLDPILMHARSLMFLDPHLDPEKSGYSEFLDMIQGALNRPGEIPLIEIHRCCYEGSGPSRRVVGNTEWESRFRGEWSSRLQCAGGNIQVFIWSDLHDRHLLSDLIGIHMGNGFDTSRDPHKKVTWSRISESDRDKMQRTVDPAVNSALLIHRFQVP